MMRIRALVLAAAAMPLAAEIRLPNVIGDHMVVQSGVPARIFGTGSGGESVTVQFNGQTATTVAGADGKWQVWLAPMQANGNSADMTIAGSNTITVHDVLVGEVWVGSGQSNMQWTVQNSNNSDTEALNANYPKIRLFRVPLKTMPMPQDDVDAKWEVCSPETIRPFSAVLYFFGRNLHKQKNVPFGLIQTAYGGTPAQAWTSKEALEADPALMPILGEWAKVLDNYPAAMDRYQKLLSEWEAKTRGARPSGAQAPRKPAMPMGPGHSHTPSGLYNAMLHPLLKYTIKGALWYQGESNASKIQAPLYRRLFETMIQDWRARWGVGEFPFLFVQLANFAKAGSPDDWVIVQEAQAKTLELRRTGMAVITDIGNPDDIHPRNKQDVSARLALLARHIAYGENIPYTSATPRQVTRETATTGDRGVKIRVWFDHAEGLKTRDGGPVKGFEVSGADGAFAAAEGRVEGASVVLASPSVAMPVQVRYAWASNPDANLVNGIGLPTSVFRGSIE
ncbi:MAG: sialate O-acetylesterase [Bryobacteraceae bacterium]